MKMTSGLFSKIVIATCFIALIIFISAVMYFIWHGKAVPDSLIYATSTAISVEFLACAWRTKKNGNGSSGGGSSGGGGRGIDASKFY